ncbi:MAG TPA: hypothetical protein VG818_04700 [Gemmatimonadaceae bacterium]|jgi:hypothetical protein|nr:hypothetical protein [Gemmatimonadaceae bacterium]
MVKARTGATSTGCLLSLLIVSAAIYFGVNIGEAYWRYYQYQDAMKQEIKFNGAQPDSLILSHLWAEADSLGLPEDAQEIDIDRDPRARRMHISADYAEQIELPLTVRIINFHPHAEGTY